MGKKMHTINEQISGFRHFSSKPQTINLSDWVTSCKEGCKYTQDVLQYRETGQEQLKKNLPLITPGALMSGGRSRSNITKKTGWISIDIDGKDNPHIKNWAKLRDKLGGVHFIAVAALSVSGNGVWALVKVANPDKHGEHFKQLIKDFKLLDLELDTSKGRNAHDARFYSYDPDCYVASSFSVYDRLPQVIDLSKQYRPTKSISSKSRYVQSAFDGEVQNVREAAEGTRNNTLFKAAANLAEFVASGHLEEQEVKFALTRAALSIGLASYEVKATLNSGFNKGIQNPRQI